MKINETSLSTALAAIEEVESYVYGELGILNHVAGIDQQSLAHARRFVGEGLRFAREAVTHAAVVRSVQL